MNKKIHCGRLIRNKFGSVNKVESSDGGGIRNCIWDRTNMDFDQIHQRLREMYSIDPKQKSVLYDIQLKELDQHQYRTFDEYINKNGFHFGQTLLYLFTSEVDNNDMIEKKQKITVPSQIVQHTIQLANKSSIKIDDQSQDNQNSTNHQNDFIANIQMSLSKSFENYSFEKSLKDVVNYFNYLISQTNHQKGLIDIFQHICTIYGLSSTSFDQLKKELQSSDEYHQHTSNDTFHQINKLSKSIKKLIELNQMTLNQYSIIRDSFDKFYQYFNILHDQWKIHTKFRSSSSINSSSSSRHHETNLRKEEGSSRDPSFSRISTKNDNKKEYLLFEGALVSFNNLLDELHNRHWISFHHLVQSMVRKIVSYRTKIKINDYQSLSDSKQNIIEIEKSLRNRMNDEYNCGTSSKRNQQVEHSYKRTLHEIKELLKSLDYYQLKIKKCNHSKTSGRSTPPPLSNSEESISNKSIINPKRKHIPIEDDQSSQSSHSSVGDEKLREIAKDAYEKRRNR